MNTINLTAAKNISDLRNELKTFGCFEVEQNQNTITITKRFCMYKSIEYSYVIQINTETLETSANNVEIDSNDYFNNSDSARDLAFGIDLLISFNPINFSENEYKTLLALQN